MAPQVCAQTGGSCPTSPVAEGATPTSTTRLAGTTPEPPPQSPVVVVPGPISSTIPQPPAVTVPGPISSTTSQSPTAGLTGTTSSTIRPTSTGVSQNTTNFTETHDPVVGSKKPLPSGAVAGVGIGCFLAGIFLAGLLLFFLMILKNKRQREYPQHHLPPEEAAYIEHAKHGMKAVVRDSGAAITTNVDRLLPQPAEDDSIIGGLSKIRDGIKNHAQSYYHNSPINYEAINETILAELPSATGIPASSLKTLLLNPSTRISAIKLILSQLVLSRCVEGQPSFLPKEIAGLIAPAGGDSSQLALFSKWKTISGALLQQKYGQKFENDPRELAITEALATAEPILQPFINPSVDTFARRRNLEGILKRAAQFAFLLFSQPGSFQFDYTGTGRRDSMVVFPALVQTVSDEAERLSTPRVLREKEIVAGLGI